MTLNPGATLQGGKYIINKVLGQGGFGITYLAEHTLLGANVAVKEFFMKDLNNRDEETLTVSVGSDGSRELVKQFKVKFLKEARNIFKLNHQNIVRILDIFEENDTAYYVMEYCSGGSLSELLRQHPDGLPEEQAVSYIQQIASAVAYIHEKKMNHLDIKPANIMLNDKGDAILIDFGLSKQYDSKTGQQTSTTPVGISEGYAPMEQYMNGGVGAFSPSTDIYALGATLYKLVTGQNPPSASYIFNEGLPTLPNTVSSFIASAIKQAMQPKTSDRPQSVHSWLEGFNNACPNNRNTSAKTEAQVKPEVKKEYDDTTYISNVNSKNDVPEKKKNPASGGLPKEKSKPKKKQQWTNQVILLFACVMAVLALVLIVCYINGLLFPIVNLIWVLSSIGASVAIYKERSQDIKNTLKKKKIGYVFLAIALIIAILVLSMLFYAPKSNYAKAWDYYNEGDYNECVNYLNKAIKEGDDEAKAVLAWFYLDGIGVEPDSDKAFSLSQESAKSGSSMGIYVNGLCYYWGIGTIADEAKALQLIKKAADSGNVDAQNRLSVIGQENGYVWVDLGLSVKWAACNIGASNKFEGGDFYAWGETNTKNNYSRETYFDKDCKIFCNGGGWTSLLQSSKYDVAQVKLGGNWRIPSEEEFNELIDNCDVTVYDTGIQLRSKINGEPLFFPTPGIMAGTELTGLDKQAGYWSSTLSEDYYGDNIYAQSWLINAESGTTDLTYSQMRGLGFCVRPVLPK